MEFKDYTIAFLLTLVCFIGVTTFLSGIATNYGYADNYLKDERLDLNAMSLAVNSTDAESYEVAFRQENIGLTAGYLVLESVWGIIKLMVVLPVTMFNLIAYGTIGVLGIPTIFIGALLDILLISLIIAGYKLLKGTE